MVCFPFPGSDLDLFGFLPNAKKVQNNKMCMVQFPNTWQFRQFTVTLFFFKGGWLSYSKVNDP